MDTVSTSMPKKVRQSEGPSSFDSSVGMLSFLNMVNRVTFCLNAECMFAATRIK